MQEKRLESRLRKRLQVKLGRTSSFTLDVSSGGFSTELARVLPPGAQVEGEIRLNEVPVAFAGRVVWSRAGDPRMNVRGKMGVRFTLVPPDFRHRLQQALA